MIAGANVYDGDGNRVSETVGSTTTKFLVDDHNPTGYSQVMDELANGSVTRTYTYGRPGAPFLARLFRARSGAFDFPRYELSDWEKWAHVLRSPLEGCAPLYSGFMPWGLKRYYGTGGLHFITWSCYRRRPLLDTERTRDLLLTVLELMRERYRFGVVGYVVMPEHVHMLISEPQIGDPSTVVQAVKLGFARRVLSSQQKPHFSREKTAREMGHPAAPNRLWQRRFYDFNVWSQKEVEKLKYMHRNPVVRGLVEKPEDWKWSSYRSYAYGEDGPVRINDWKWWEEKIRDKTG